MLDPITVEKREAIIQLWQRSVLYWKLDATQKELYDSYKNADSRTIVWSCARRGGKSFTLCTIAIETCLKKANIIVKYTAPTQKAVKLIIAPLIRKILHDCPKDLRPEYKTAEHIYRFKNGSEIQLAGTDSGNAENLRGGEADLCIVDEAGFCSELEYIVKSILIPTMTTTRGKIILASTPPVKPDHDFVSFMEKAQQTGSFVKKTIYDNVRLEMADIESIIKEVGGVNSNQFKREYLCQIIKDEDTAVVPEFDDDLRKVIVKEHVRPPFFDAYEAMDLGKKDLTVVLYSYVDFSKNLLVIEDESVMNGAKLNTSHLAKAVKEKERILWADPLTLEVKEPYLRVSDNNHFVITDLWALHGMEWIPTKKDDADAALNNMRVMLESKRILIHPRCTTLIRHLENARWNKQRTSYARSTDDGHYDAIDALKYLVRNVQWNRNPYPKGYNIHWGDNRISNPFYRSNLPSAYEGIKNIFQMRKSLGRK